MLNYSNLNDVEFEYLCKDIMQVKINKQLHRFASGRDGGIDLADDVSSKNIIVQVKYYMKSTVSQLMAALKDEVDKVARLSPAEYYICCSKELSPQKVDEIYQLFSDYMSSPSNVITLNDIDDFLKDSANVEILKKHYKLWIDSTGILDEIGNSNVFVDCETLLADIEREKLLFVETSAFNSALRCLNRNKVLFITGHPGVGKTITSKMLVLYYAANGYRVRFSTNVSDLDELKKSLSRNPDTKEIILVDDCLGQAYFNMKESQSTELLSLINYVNTTQNKLLILNSRITILQEAKERKSELLKCLEGEKCKVYILDMAALDIVEKARIFYNHITFCGMDKGHFDEIKKEKRYINIIRHPNYTPRIIEFVCNPNRYIGIAAGQFYEFIMQQLKNPKEIWKDEYERRLQKADRLLLLTLYSLSDVIVDEEEVKSCFETLISRETGIDNTINQYEASMARLLDGFVRLVVGDGTRMIKMVNPSVNDYIDGRLKESAIERRQLIDSVVTIKQKKRLMSESEFNMFMKSAIENHTIGNYLFESEEQKNAFIAFYIRMYNIYDEVYTDDVHAFINKPCRIYPYKTGYILPVENFKGIICEDICKFYKVAEFLTNECKVAQMLSYFDFDDMVEVICMIEGFFSGGMRDRFVKTASEQIRNAIEVMCGSLDAYDFNPDCSNAIEASWCGDEHYDSIDTSHAVSYIEDAIVEAAEDDIDRMLALLPIDIRYYMDYTDELYFCVYGAENYVDEYLNEDFDFDKIIENRVVYENPGDEIEHIFNRNKE